VNNRGKKVAQEVSDMINNMSNREDIKTFIDFWLNEHRYLQNDFNTMIIKYAVKVAKMYDAGYYDGRNEGTVRDLHDMVTKSGIDQYYV
jgi:hypothetical protein